MIKICNQDLAGRDADLRTKTASEEIGAGFSRRATGSGFEEVGVSFQLGPQCA
jgi:hypothetical protein